jgi:thiamine-phosphate pyrophosphorylase
MLVTDDRLLGGRDPVAVCRAAERGGVTAVQLRLKEASPRELLATLRRLRAAVRVPVLVNDRLDVAIAGGAAGAHLGPDDLPIALARKAAAPNFLLGASVGTIKEIPNGAAADYWGVGPFRSTGTKTDAGSALGVEGLMRLVGGGRPTSEGPTCRIAIGGVKPEDVSAIIDAGASGIAVVSGILAEDDVESAARLYSAAIARALSALAQRPANAPRRSG